MATTSAFAFESITVSDKVKMLTRSLFAPPEGIAEVAFLTVEGEVRFRYDGGDPTGLEGHLLKDGSFFKLVGELQMNNFKVVGIGSDEYARLSVSYERT